MGQLKTFRTMGINMRIEDLDYRINQQGKLTLVSGIVLFMPNVCGYRMFRLADIFFGPHSYALQKDDLSTSKWLQEDYEKAKHFRWPEIKDFSCYQYGHHCKYKVKNQTISLVKVDNIFKLMINIRGLSGKCSSKTKKFQVNSLNEIENKLNEMKLELL